MPPVHNPLAPPPPRQAPHVVLRYEVAATGEARALQLSLWFLAIVVASLAIVLSLVAHVARTWYIW